MAISRSATIGRWLGILTLVLAWTAAGIEYSNSGEIRWSLIAAGLVFAALPFAGWGTKPGSGA